MIKKIALLLNAYIMSGVMLPLGERILQARHRREAHQCMEVIWHEQEQMHPPIAVLFTEHERIMHPSSGLRLAKLILATRLGANSDEVDRAILDPRWNTMRQFFPLGKHVGTKAESIWER